MLLALAEELDQGGDSLNLSLNIFFDLQAPEEFLAAAKDEYCEFTARVAGVANVIGLDGLQVLMSFIDANVSAFANLPADQRSNNQVFNLLQSWPSALSGFLREPLDAQSIGTLHGLLFADDWLEKVNSQQFENVIQGIKSYATGETASALQDKDELLNPTAADVSIRIPDDVSPKLLTTFQQELPESTSALSQRIQKLFDKKATLDDISEARRVAHTLKGAANIVGVIGIANITHYLEDILEFLVKKGGLPSSELTSVLIEATDCLEIMAEAALGMLEPPPQALQVLESLLDWKRKFSSANFDESASLQNVAVSPTSSSPESVSENAASTPTVKETFDFPASASPIPGQGPGNIFDKLLNITGELSSSNLVTRSQLERTLKKAEALNKYHHTLYAHMNFLQDLVFTQGLKKHSANAGGGHGLNGNFDPLEMDQYNELHSAVNVFAELLDDASDISKHITTQLTAMRELLTQQDQLNKELDQSIMAERLVSVKTVLPRLQRSMRQTCRMTGKKAELFITGDSLNIDNLILDTIMDPLLHILRNAVDHGIEQPQERQLKGKPETAAISLSFERFGNSIVVRCKDDGRGIDINAVKSKALQMGLIDPEQVVSEKALIELILQPGFSTRPDANQVSGRGMGMDVVAKKISDLRGSLNISSERNIGTEFIITVPQTLLKAHVILLKTDELLFGILSSSFDQITNIEPDAFAEREGMNCIMHNEQVYETKYLMELLGIRKYSKAGEKRRMTAILVDDNDAKSATLVDEAVSNGELVIKKLGKYIPRIGGIIGTVLTPDGTAAPVFDLKDLLRKPSQLVADYLQQHREQSPVSVVNVLIVDDSSSARRSLSQAAKDAGYDVRTAIDGVEAITLIEERRPDLVLTDLEMPKMNGLELVAHLRASENTRNLPIVMVTSRSTEKHKAQAISTGVNSYVTKPFTNDDLIYEMHQLLGRS